jgi:hypothetical protein
MGNFLGRVRQGVRNVVGRLTHGRIGTRQIGYTAKAKGRSSH